MFLEYFPKKDEVKQYVKAYFPSNEKAKNFAELCTGNNLFLLAEVMHSVCVRVNFNPFFTDDSEKIRDEIERLYAQAINAQSSEGSSDGNGE